MARAYYSTVFDTDAERIWATIRDFGSYSWAGTGIEATVEDGRAGDAVGAVRAFDAGGVRMRQRLLAHSDIERSYTYEFCEPAPIPVRGYQGTLRITPVTDGNRAFVEWEATFEDDDPDWAAQLQRESLPGWLDSLRKTLGV